MLCREPGVLPGSERFLSTASPTAERLQYFFTCCGHYHCDQGYSIRRDYIPTLILMSIQQGALDLEYKDRRYVAQAGDVVLMDCTSEHFYYAPGYVEFYWMHIEGVNSFDICRYLTEEHGIVFRVPRGGEIAEILHRMIAAYRNQQPRRESEDSLSILRMLTCLMPDMREVRSPLQKDGAVERLKQYIGDHLEERLSLPELAREAGLSPSYLIRLFAKKTGMSPHEYVVATRVGHAKYLLKTTELSVKEIARMVGYESEQGFIGAFVQRIGMAPGKFRHSPLE